MIESRQSYCNENRVQFIWPTRYVHWFVNEFDVDLSKPGYVLDTTIISHFCAVALT